MQIAYCDDDERMLQEIDGLLVQYRAGCSEELVCTAFRSPLDLLARVEEGLRPDILILDVVMPGGNGISVAREIRERDDAVKIIFLSSTAEFAAQSYAVDAYYYQMKPIDKETFFALLDAVISACGRERQKSLILRCKGGITKVALEKIAYCEVIGRTLSFHLENGSVLESAGSLEELAQKLSDSENFYRPHRSFLINLDYIQNISAKTITMEDLSQIPIPHGKCAEIKKSYLAYAFRRKQVCLNE